MASKLNWPEIIETIQQDNLEKFKSYHLPSANINQPLTHKGRLQAKHGNDVLPYYVPDQILVLSYIIFCKARQILGHVNTKLFPKYDNIYGGHAPVHHLCMVADEDMILNAFQTESFQRSLVFPSQVTFSNEVHSSFPIHIAVTHRNVPMFFYMLRPYPDCPKKLRVPSTDPIPRVDLFSQTTKGTIPLEVAVFGLDITMVLLILSFYNENGYSLTDEVLTKLNERLVPKPDQDALSKVKITAISGILSQFSLFALKPEEIFRNWKSDNRFYEKHYLQPPSDQNVHIEPPPPAPEPAQFKCAVCNTEANLFTCQGCGNFFCSSCFHKPFFHPCARTG